MYINPKLWNLIRYGRTTAKGLDPTRTPKSNTIEGLPANLMCCAVSIFKPMLNFYLDISFIFFKLGETKNFKF